MLPIFQYIFLTKFLLKLLVLFYFNHLLMTSSEV